VLSRAVDFIFKSPSVYSDPSISADARFGLPCAVKILGFLCQKLQPRGTTATGVASPLLPTRREVLLSFMLLQHVLVACDANQLAHTSSLMLFIKDDVCGAILRYGRLGASSDLKIPVLCLSILRLLWTKLRFMLKMQLEALFNGVFCHTLHWTIAHLDLAHPIFPNNLESVAVPPTPSLQGEDGSSGGGFTYVDAVREEFTGEIVPLNKLFSISFEILDCLVDVLAEPTLLPDLYVNYDCDGNRSDLTYTLFELLSRVVTQTHNACQETSDEVHFLWARAIGELALRGLFNALYVVYSRSQSVKLLASEGVAIHGGEVNKAEALHTKRQRKKLFQHGIHEFNRKPLSGIKYLQQNSFLPTPLDPKSLAAFLRSLPPGLNKVAVGMYLGAMGKEVKDFEKSDIHEADTIEFHREVLEHFVRSFNFESDSIVAALRMFLASFRLPGEAQQIDRILNTFSIQVYEQCRDRFLMASPDVAYLLSFSLIMLNTDLHNPNIRPEKKMKLEDFIKNNRNYGEEVSRNRDLPDDFMTELYDAIAKEEIKTREDDSKHGEVTTDRWKDLLYQAEHDPVGSRLVVHRPVSRVTLTSRTVHQNGSRSSSPQRHALREDSPRRREFKSRKVKSTSSLESLSFGADDDQAGENGTSNQYDTGHHYDRDIFNIMQTQLKRAFSSVFQQFIDVANGPNGGLSEKSLSGAVDARNNDLPEDIYLPDKGMLQLACNGFVLCAATASSHDLVNDFNEFFVSVTKFTGLYVSDLYPIAYNGQVNGVAMYCHNQSAPVATAAMLKIVNTCSKSIHKESWKHFFHAIGGLREFGALPDRFLHGAFGSSDILITVDESIELLELVRTNREDLERREAQRLKDANRTQSSSGFFSGVAWLMSALDTSASGSAPTTPVSSGSQLVISGRDGALSDHTPADMAVDARDLLIKPEPKMPTQGTTHQPIAFGTREWIRQTLQPYHVERLLDELSVLPLPALNEVVRALHDELDEAFTGSPKIASTESRMSTFPGTGSSPIQPEENVSRAASGHCRLLSPAGCVLFEHILSRLLAALPRDSIHEQVDGLWNALEIHYLNLPSLIRPILLKNAVVNGVGYDCAAYILAKAMEGLLLLVLKDRREKTLGLLMGMLTALVDMSADDDDLLRPYLTLLFTGLKRVADSIDLRRVNFERGEWLTVSNLIGWATEQPHASVHAFAFLEKLIASEVWLAEVETTFSLTELYTKTLLFALQDEPDSSDPSASIRWPRRRPLELLNQLFERLDTNDIAVEEEERLRQIGGMVLLCRHALRSCTAPADGESISTQVNEMAIVSLEFLRAMILSAHNRGSLSGGAWLEIVGSGLLTISSELLSRKSRLHATLKRSASLDDGGSTLLSSSFAFYEQNVPPKLALKPMPRDASAKDRTPSGRRRRPSIVKDPLALRPHLLVVEMVSWVACEQLDQLLLLPRFASVWDESLDQLLAYVELTKPTQRSNNAGAANDEVLAALERRSIMSAHDEIVEHVKSVIRRLSAMLRRHETSHGGGDDSGNSALAGARFHALMHVLVEKCQSKGPAFYEQLFPAQEDSLSAGERTPPVEEEDAVMGSKEDDEQAGECDRQPIGESDRMASTERETMANEENGETVATSQDDAIEDDLAGELS
jgi:hypothetical protein